MNKKRILSLLLAFCMLVSVVSIDAVVSAAEPTNVALATNGTTITSNRISSFGEQNGLGLEQMIDGNTGNYGITKECGKDEETTLDLTFKQTYLVSQVRMRTRETPTSPVDYTLCVWTTNGWKEVVQVVDHVQSADNEWLEHTFPAVACRAVRLSVTEHGKDGGNTYSIYMREFEAYGVETTEEIGVPVDLSNIALATNGTTITSNRISSFGEENGLGLEQMIDGNAGNYGITEGCEKDEETTLDLIFKQSYLVSQVRMRTRENPTSPVDYTLSVWTTNGWKEVVQVVDHVQSADNEWLEHTFPAVACRAVRLSVTEHGKDGGNTYSIYMREFEAYGVPSAKIVPVPADPTNVALATNGTTITSNRISSFGEQNGLGLEQMIDGNTGNYGITKECGKDEETTLDLTFKQSYLVSEVRMRTRETPTSPVDYTLSVWTTNGWKEVVQVVDHVQSADNEWLEHTFSAVACRAVRLSVTEHGKDGGNTYSLYMREFEVYGIPTEEVIPVPADLSNIALKTNGTTITSNRISSFGEQNGLGLDEMIDGNSGNYGITEGCGKDEETTLDLTFKQTYLVSQVRMRTREKPTSPVDYTLSVWTTNGWKEVVQVVDHVQTEDSEWLEHTFSAVACRAVRLSVTEHGNDGSTYSIYMREFEVYGIPTEEVVAEPPVLYNLAYGMQVTSGSVVDWGAPTYGNNLNNLVDNNGGKTNYSSTWGPVDYNYEWVQITFDAPVRAYYVQFTPWTSGELKRFPKDFCIEVYNGTEWETVIEKTDYSEEVYMFEFAKPMECSALRLVATQLDHADSDTNYALLIADMKVFGECANVTLQRPDTLGEKINRAEASVVLSKGTNNVALKDHCTNGVVNYKSQLVESPEDEIAIQYLFGRSLYVDSIKFQVHNDDKGKFPADVDIYAFTGEKWEQVLDVTGYTCTETASEHYFSFKGVYCNSLMIVAKNLYELDGAYGMRLRNIQVLGVFADDACTLLGDGSGDGKLTEAEDCTAFREYIVNSSETSMQYDINMDETGDVRDLVRMKRYFIGN